MTQIPAGWYPDPAPPQPGRAPQLRYWDGATWTEHVAPAQQVAPAPQTPLYATEEPTRGPTTPDGVPVAGWGWRALALFLDGLILGIAANVLTLPVQLRVQRETAGLVEDMERDLERNPDRMPELGRYVEGYLDIVADNAVWLVLPGLVLSLVYVAGFLRWKAATPGKMVVGLRVRLRDQPGPLPWSTIGARVGVQYLLPWAVVTAGLFSGSLGLVAVTYLAAFAFFAVDGLWPLWDDKRQAVHDKAARTNVVKSR